MGTDPNSPDNRWLRDAMEHQIPVAYFLGVSPGRYQPIIPTFIVGWHPESLRVELAFGAIVGASAQATLPAAPERRYALREAASFREGVLTAYGGRCAISRLPEPRLLDAAHIVMDADEQLGQPIIPNGLPLSKIHHAAFDAHLIGIDPDFRIHVSDRLLDIRDGPFLELGLKGIVGQVIEMPRRREDYPDRDRLARKFERFKSASNGASTRSRRCSLSGGADIETRRRPLARLSITRSRPVLDGALYFAVILRALLCSNLTE